MKLTKSDRLLISAILPEKGKFEDLMLKKDIVIKLDLTKKEKKDINLKNINNGLSLSWKDLDNKETDIELSSSEITFIKSVFEKTSAQEALTMSQLPTMVKLREYKIEV